MLGIFQLVVALTMMPQVFFFGVPGVLGSLGMSESGHFDVVLSGVPKALFLEFTSRVIFRGDRLHSCDGGCCAHTREAIAIQRSSLRGRSVFLLDIYRRVSAHFVRVGNPLQLSLHDSVGRNPVPDRCRRRDRCLRALFPD